MAMQICVLACAAALPAVVPAPSSLGDQGLGEGGTLPDPVDSASANGVLHAFAEDPAMPGEQLSDMDTFDFFSSGMVSAVGFSAATGSASASQGGGVAEIVFTSSNEFGVAAEPISETTFSFSFTTIVDAFYDFEVTATSPLVSILFNDDVADRFPDIGAPGGVGGSIGADGVFAVSGFLPAGGHSFSGSTSAALLGATPVSGSTTATLTLTAVPSPGGAACLLGPALLAAGRRRRSG